MDILDEIEQLVDELENSISAEEESVEYIYDHLNDFRDEFWVSGSDVSRMQGSYVKLRDFFAYWINDIEIASKESYANRMVSRSRMRSIEISEGGLNFRISPYGRTSIKIPRDIGRTCYFCELKTPLIIEMGGQNRRHVTLIIRVAFHSEGQHKIKPIAVSSPRFFDGFEEVDPFLSIPVTKQQYARIKLMEALAEALDDSTYKIDRISFSGIQVQPKPLIVLINRNFINFICRENPESRKLEPVIVSIPPFMNQSIKIRKHLVEPFVRKEASKRGRVTKLDWSFNAIILSTQIKDEQTFLHIKVKTKVNMTHAIDFTTRGFRSVDLRGRWREYSFDIEAKNCFPVCSEVIDLARVVVKREINKAKYFSQNIGYFGNKADLVAVKVNLYGIVINLKARN